MLELLEFLAGALVVSLSGVLAPGPMTASALAAGVRQRHAGVWLAIGHGVIEFPLMVLIVLGAGAVFERQWFQTGVGIAGGLALLIMGGMMLAGARRSAELAPARETMHPLLTGIVLTAANPYFLVWWATVGLALTTSAIKLGAIAFALFALIHWLCDLVWLEVLSFSSHGGTKLLGPRSQKIILIVCGAAMAMFGVVFCWQAGAMMREA